MKITCKDKEYEVSYPVSEKELIVITDACMRDGHIIIDEDVTIMRNLFLQHDAMDESCTFLDLLGEAMACDPAKFVAARELFRKLLQNYISKEIDARL